MSLRVWTQTSGLSTRHQRLLTSMLYCVRQDHMMSPRSQRLECIGNTDPSMPDRLAELLISAVIQSGRMRQEAASLARRGCSRGLSAQVLVCRPKPRGCLGLGMSRISPPVPHGCDPRRAHQRPILVNITALSGASYRLICRLRECLTFCKFQRGARALQLSLSC